jgi:plastocyanin
MRLMRIALAALVVAALVVLTACAGIPNPPGDNKVTIADLKFIPSTIEVERGSTVTWTNNDQTAHTVTSDDFPDPSLPPTTTVPAGAFSSKPLDPGDSFSHTFDKPGKYPYHCQIHTYLKGEVIVK